MDAKQEKIKKIDQNTYACGDILLHSTHGVMDEQQAAETFSQIAANMEADGTDK